jgi:ketosteroid isomerase-like protein
MSAPADTSPGARYSALLERFKTGWEKGNADRVVDLFTPDGVFVAAPFDPPAKGHDAIRAYWRDAPLEQAEVDFRFGEIFVAGPWFATEFKCTFRRRRTGHKVVVRGALFCETSGDLLSEMRMYWDRVVDRLPG